MKKRFLIAAAAAFLAAAALFYLYRTEEGAGAGIPCVFHLLTGWYCPGCGASRALRALLHFDLGQALRYNAPFAVASPFVGIYALSLAVSFVRFCFSGADGNLAILVDRKRKVFYNSKEN